MKYNKYHWIGLSVFLILLLFLGSASAANADEMDILSIDESTNLANEYLALDVSSDISSSSNASTILENNGNNLLSADNNVESNENLLGASRGTYNDFKKEIMGGMSSGYVKLLMDSYTFDNSANVISINEQCTIDGNGATIDANSKCSVFDITASNVVIKNLIIKNAVSSTKEGGGAFYFGQSSSGCTVVNCSFVNNRAVNGGAISFGSETNNNKVESCAFVNNTATGSGYAIYSLGGTVSSINDNWWGSNSINWKNLIGGKISQPSTYAELRVTPISTTIAPGSNATLTYAFYRGKSNTLLSIIGRPIEFKVSGGSLDPDLGILTNGVFSTNFSSTKVDTYKITATVDGQTLQNTVTVQGITPVITVKNSILNLLVGDKGSIATIAGISVSPTDAGSFNYSSSNDGVVSVDSSGVIYANSAGTASVTVHLVPNTGYAQPADKYITVNVRFMPTVNVVNSTLDLLVGDEGSIATIAGISVNPTGAGSFNYSSSDDGVVSVDSSGVIHANGAGTANVTVHLVPNPGYAQPADKSITVSVTLNDAKWTYIYTGQERELDKSILFLPWNYSPICFVKDANGVGLPAGTNITIFCEGNKNYTINTIAQDNGQFSVDVSDMALGKYKVTFSVEGYTTATATITILKVPTEIAVANETIALKVNDQVGSGATLTPADAGNLTYTSSNETVAVVVDGKIKAVGEGNATITVSFDGNDKYFAAVNKTIDVTVTLKDAKVDAKDMELTVDSKGTINYTTTPEGLNVSFVPDDSGVVNVTTGGTVTALKNGTAQITVLVGDGKIHALNSTVITVTVSKVPTEITVDPDSLDLSVGDETVIVANLTPADAGNVTFTSSDDSIVLVDAQGNVIANAKGQVIITVSFVGDNKYAAAENKTITVNVKLDDASVTVDNDTLDLKVNETCAINATKHPDTILLDIDYSSSDESVATVDKNGVVTAVGEGTAIITVEVGDDEIYAKNSTNVTVTVSLNDASVSANDMILIVGENATVKFTTNPKGLNVSFVPDDSGIIKVDKNGVVTGVKEGTASITVKVGDGKVYALNSTVITVTVNEKPSPSKENLTISASADPITTGENATVKVTGLEKATGEVSVIANGQKYTAPIKNSEATVIVPGLTENTTAIVNYGGDDKYNSASTTVNITVNPKGKENATISIDAPTEATEGDNVTVTVTLPSDATGTVNIGNEAVPIVNGTATAVLTNLPAGNVTVPITYSGDEKYNPIETSISINVKEDESIIIKAPDVTKYFHGPERFVANLTDDKGNPIVNANVTITINGVDYNRTTDASGQVSIAINLNSGEYPVVVTYNGTTVNATVTVLATLNGTDVVKVFRNDTQYYATFYDAEGNYLENGTDVRFNINGVMYERKVSGDKGLAKLNINLQAGEYLITATNMVTGESASNKIIVVSRITENSDITKYYRNGTQYTVKVLGDDGNPVGAGETVKFNVNGVIYERQTNESGIAKLNINLHPGDYIITAEYKDSTVSNNIKVLPVLNASDITMKYRDGTKFVATLVDGQGKPYENQIIQFNVNGVSYDRVTDSNGQAKLNINLMSGEYVITSSYNGSNIANKITISS